MKQVNILGIPFTNIDHVTLVQQLQQHIEKREKSFVATANPEIVMRAHDDSYYMNCLQAASYITADGVGIVKASQLLKNPLPERVTGYDIMMEFLKKANENKYRIYLLGAKEDTLERAVKTINHDYPDIEVAGYRNGYFHWDDPTIAEDIERTKPDIIFVALGAPKQERWIAENFQTFGQGVFICVGGSIDVIAGDVKRAPIKWQNMNLEWLYRLMRQPSRWRRMHALPRFACRVIRQRFGRSS
ncbi:WecB/TagA/CpsF family glycosyltransferase [Halobacillus karajensis]|uniref:N-acetylglucosaminyldiphosphoundecaprenol N-acetyl-beta-D-mannosaminyltransferase n=1 Tax=Halobacillus karajensis TaxID=195088 RepID=A0A059NVA8_9BACI|nr:WecB/TagA/CpsF family glycosyltransferase [Halobacillus karajensis]CDQ18922.1 Putative N-acetylmannosaminyltransferase [Halobacillus karajensis]CDQ23005.1 Putative N-acetylmannosaminyltransferase [Halobacillus karajensis]CDQ26487.1 Putative N-acetylmannosaminyltransferase [Halobacillus karajensis]